MGTRERRVRSNQSDRILTQLFQESGADPQELAIAAVGGFGRGELTPGSDLDIVIIHSGTYGEKELSELVNKILYPLWDSKIDGRSVKIDHSVRTPAEMKIAAASDLKVALGLLDIRLICGSADLVADVQSDALAAWRKDANSRLVELQESLRDRHQKMGELAYLLEPDLKEARGGIRDITALRAIDRANLISVPIERISFAESLFANVRETLHLVSGRDKDKLLFQEQDKVAAALGYVDADALMSDIAQAARSVDYVLDITWYRLAHKGRDGLGRFFKKVRSTQISRDISVANKEIVIGIDVDFDLGGINDYKLNETTWKILNSFFKLDAEENRVNELTHLNNNNVKKFLSNIDESFINVNDFTFQTDVCKYCNIGELIPVEHEGILVCNHCSRHVMYLFESEKPSYKEPPKEVCFYAYKRINHFKEILAQFQAKETTQRI